MKHYLACGVGVNSTALLVWLVKNEQPLDEVVFADTGAELKETYDYLPTVKAFCEKHSVPFTVLRSRYGNIYDYYFSKQAIPAFQKRDCTSKFKQQPQFAYYKEQGATAKNPSICYLGIASDEARRCGESPRKYLKLRFPLVEAGIDRAGCVRIIKEAGLPVPVKSGCFFCLYQPKDSWLWLRRTHPCDFKKSMELEENALRRNPKAFLRGHKPLSEINALPEFDEKQQRLGRSRVIPCVCFKESALRGGNEKNE